MGSILSPSLSVSLLSGGFFSCCFTNLSVFPPALSLSLSLSLLLNFLYNVRSYFSFPFFPVFSLLFTSTFPHPQPTTTSSTTTHHNHNHHRKPPHFTYNNDPFTCPANHTYLSPPSSSSSFLPTHSPLPSILSPSLPLFVLHLFISFFHPLSLSLRVIQSISL